MNSEIFYKQINDLEKEVENLYSNGKLKSSILDKFDDLQKKIKNQSIKEPDNQLLSTYLKNLDLFRERINLKLTKIDLEHQLQKKKNNKNNLSNIFQIVSPSSIQSTNVQSNNVQSTSIESKKLSRRKSKSYLKYAVFFIVFLIIIFIIYLILGKL